MTQDRRVAVVTGANRGIGLEVARQLGEAGLRVVLTARDREAAREVADMLAAEGLDVAGHELDVTEQDAVDELRGYLRATYGRCDVLVNNAGALFDAGWGDRPGSSSAFEAQVQTLRDTMEVNVYGPFRMCQSLIPLMREHGYGRVVNVSSGMGQLSDMNGGYPGYRISKTAINAVTRIFADETKADPNVKVNSVCPGWVRTEMGGPSATRSVAEGAQGLFWAATLPSDGPSGGFFRDGQPLDW